MGIPKYNVDADAPSGLGFNAAMDSVDALIAARVLKPAGLANTEFAVWNGTSFDRSTVTRPGPASLGTGTPDATKFLRGDGSWQPAGDMVKLFDTTLGSTALIDWQSIPQTFAHLRLVISGRDTGAGANANSFIRLNNDSGTNYDYMFSRSNGSAISVAETFGTTIAYMGEVPAATAPANAFSAIIVEIPNYANASILKALNISNASKGAVTAGGMWFTNVAASWRSIAAINRITLINSWAAGTRATLYGLN